MSEVAPRIGEEPLLAIQTQIYDLHKELRGESRLHDPSFDAPAALAAPLRAELAGSPVGDLLVSYGEILQPNQENYATYRLPAIRPGLDAELMGVSFGSSGYFTERRRIVPSDRAAELEGREDVHVFPLSEDKLHVQISGKYDWDGQVYLTFWYFQHFLSGVLPIGERLTASTYHDSPGSMPTLASSVVITRGVDGGPTAYERTKRPARSEEEASIIVDAVRRLKSAKEAAT